MTRWRIQAVTEPCGEHGRSWVMASGAKISDGRCGGVKPEQEVYFHASSTHCKQIPASGLHPKWAEAYGMLNNIIPLRRKG